MRSNSTLRSFITSFICPLEFAKPSVGLPLPKCTHWRVLTDEHFPPQSSGNIGLTWAHTMNGMSIAHRTNKIAPPMEYANGLKRRSLCQKCNHDTQEWYNAAFKFWTDQARIALPTNAD